MLFDTWFLSGRRLPRCSFSRAVALPAEVHLWNERLRQVWRDRIRPLDDLQIVPIAPDPSGSSPGGQLLLLQHVHPEEAGVILSHFDNPYRRNPNDRFAQLVPRALSFHRLLWFLDLEVICPHRDYDCTGYHGTTQIRPEEAWPARHGQHLELYVRPAAVTEEDEDMDLMQTTVTPHQHGVDIPGDATECTQFHFNAAAASFTPTQWNIFAASEFVQDLHQEWQLAAFAWENEEPSCLIDVWFVDHMWPWPHGFHSKQVRLYEDFNTWEDTILQAWQELLVPGALKEFSVVHPHPPNALSACHVIVVQNPRVDWVTSLVSVLDADRGGLLLHQSAVTTHENILLDNFLTVAGRHAHCLGFRPSHRCQARFLELPLLPGRPIMGRTGYGIVIHLEAISSSRPSDSERVPLGRILLQLSSLLHQTSPPDIVHSDYLDYVQGRDFSEQARLTTDSVAHGQWPCFRSCDGSSTVVRLLSSTSKLTLPIFVELRHPVSAEGVQAELVLWGHQCDVTFIDELHLAVCFPTQEASVTTRIYLPDAFCEPLRPLYNEIEPSIVSEFSVLHDMKFLHHHGYSKAVVTSSFELCHRSQLVLFREPEGSMAERQTKDRPPPTWPEPQPQGTSGRMFVPADAPTDISDCRLNLGIDAATLKSFFNCSDFCLHTSFEGLDLSGELYAFLANLPLLADRTPDRYIVYVDGSSQGHQDHKPVEWIEEQGIADAWAMIALAETYQRPDAPHQLFLVGWTSQQVRMDPNSPFYIGSKYTGSLAAEREGLFWSAMWRIGLNSTIPTLFRSDSTVVV